MRTIASLPAGSARRCRGLSIVELLVGVAAGLVVVAAAVGLFGSQVREHRRLLLEARLTQDLSGAAELIARDLRRAGYWGDAGAGVRTTAAAPRTNPYAAVEPMAAASDAAAFSWSRDAVENHAVDDEERFGWRLRAGAVELRLGASPWQAVTDATLLTVTEFAITPSVEAVDLGGLCTRPCAGAAASAGTCPPRLLVRSLSIRLAGRSAADAGVRRSVSTRVRLRNDAVVGSCAA